MQTKEELDEYKKLVRLLDLQPSAELVAQVERSAYEVARDFTSVDEVLTTAAIMARISLRSANFKGICCPFPVGCAEASLISVWLQATSGTKYFIPPEIWPELEPKLNGWSERSDGCTCPVAAKHRLESQYAAQAAAARERQEYHNTYMRDFGHISMSLRD